MVGRPVPSTIAASIVMTSAMNSVSCARPTTHCVNTMPSPDSVTTPIMMPAEAQASATASEFLAPSTIASMTFGQRDVDARRLAQRRHREAGERAGERGKRRAVAGIHDDQQDDDRQEQVSALGHDDAQARQLRARHADDAAALGLEMHRREAGDVIEDRRE